MPVEKNDVWGYAAVVGISTFSGAMLPLIPYFFLSVRGALISAMVISVIVLAGIGIYKANMTMGKPFKSALQMVLIGMGAAIAGYLIGLLFKK